MDTQTGKAEREHAPSPDHGDKPDSPADLEKPSWKFALKRTVKEFSDDQCTDLAAALTYYAVLSLFPAVIAIVSLLGVFGQGQRTTEELLRIVEEVAPGSVAETVQGPLESLTQSPAAGPALVIGLLTALWSASGYVGAFGRAMNRIYQIDEGRPFWKLRPVQLLVTLVAVVLVCVAAVGLVVSGPLAEAVGASLGLGSAAVTAYQIAKWPVLVLIAVVIIAILYYATPNVRQPKFRWMSMGAFVALLVWVLASALFAFYIANFGSFDATYGSLAGVIVFLLWLWITNLALLFGAEFDSETERSRELQAGQPAEEELQLPARDTSKIDKKAAKEEEDLQEARELRRNSGR
jgi:membrane protein